MVKFGVSTWLWTSPFSTESVRLFKKIHELGFTHVEIPVEDVDLIDEHAVRSALDSHDLKPIVCGVFGPTKDLTHDDQEVRDNCIHYMKRCFDLCNAWDASFVVGPMYAAVGKARLVSPEQRKLEWRRAVEGLRIICEEAAKSDLSIGIEPLNRFETDMINRTSDLVKLIDDIGHPAAGIALDSFHMTIEEPSLYQAIVEAGDKLIHVQVSENYRGTPGTGQTRWDEILRGLEEIGYDGVVSIESFTPEVKELAGAVCIWRPLATNQDDFAADGLRFLKGLFNQN